MASKKGAQKPIRAKGSDKCPHHQGRQVIFVCKDCNGSLACVSCVTSVHSKHKMEEIADALPAIKIKIQNYVDTLEKTRLPEMKAEIKSLESKQTEIKENCEDVITKVKTRTKELKKELDRLEAEYIQACRDVESVNLMNISEGLENIQSLIKDMELEIKKKNNLLQSGSEVQLYDASEDIFIFKYFSCPDTFFINLQFLPEFDSVTSIKRIMAGLYTEDSHNVKLCYPWVHLNSVEFSPENDYIENIFLTSNNKCWAYYAGYLHLVNAEGATEDRIVLNDLEITDFSVSPTTNVIWWYKEGERRIGRIVNGLLVTAFKTQKDPLCISVSKKDDDIIAGMCDHLVRYTHRGKVMCKTEVQKFGDPVIRYHQCISQCPNTGNVAFADAHNVSIFSETLQPLFCTDRKQSRINDIVSGIWYMKDGTLFILDGDRVLHITANGTFIQAVLIVDPAEDYIIGVGSNGDLWTVYCFSTGTVFKKSSTG